MKCEKAQYTAKNGQKCAIIAEGYSYSVFKGCFTLHSATMTPRGGEMNG